MTRVMTRMALAAAVVCSTAVVSPAQTTTTSETKTFEVLAVEGNTLVVRLPEGTRELTVANDFRFTVNGQQLSVQQLKVGMKGTATVTTRTTVTPVTVTEVKNGKVTHAMAGSIIVQTDEGYRSFTQGEIDKRGVKIMREGKPAQVSDFRPGDRLSATIITSMPPQVLTEQQVNATLAAAPAAGGGRAAAASGSSAPAGSSAAASTAPRSASASAASGSAAAPGASGGGAARTLPKTASSWPLVGLASVLSLAIGLGLTIRRRVVG
jgi:hypothetical protein